MFLPAALEHRQHGRGIHANSQKGSARLRSPVVVLSVSALRQKRYARLRFVRAIARHLAAFIRKRACVAQRQCSKCLVASCA